MEAVRKKNRPVKLGVLPKKGTRGGLEIIDLATQNTYLLSRHSLIN